MRRMLLLFGVLMVSAWAHAGALPWGVESLKKAQDVCNQDDTKHVLVFYTHWRG